MLKRIGGMLVNPEYVSAIYPETIDWVLFWKIILIDGTELTLETVDENGKIPATLENLKMIFRSE